VYDDEPELAGYDPGDGRPLRSPRLLLAMRLIVVVGLIALVLPGIITTVSVAAESAQASCKRWVGYEEPSSPGSNSVFEIFGAHGTGWQCYTSGMFGGDEFVVSLGIIPGMPVLPKQQSNS
jgi:hypothetical protein